MKKKPTAGDKKAAKVFHKWKAGTLNSGTARGPVVKSQKQAIAIALSEKARADAKAKKGKGKRKAKKGS